MKRALRYLHLVFILFCACSPGITSSINDGDIIFQESLSSQGEELELATGSKYTHMGIIYKYKEKIYVYEAVQPVKLTPLDSWINNGRNRHYVIKRLKNADKILTAENISKLKKAGEYFRGKNYDILFQWSDDTIYCSELVWKMYKRALNIEIGKLQKFRDFNLSDPRVKALIKKRYGNRINLNETVISPAAVFNSDLLVKVKEEN